MYAQQYEQHMGQAEYTTYAPPPPLPLNGHASYHDSAPPAPAAGPSAQPYAPEQHYGHQRRQSETINTQQMYPPQQASYYGTVVDDMSPGASAAPPSIARTSGHGAGPSSQPHTNGQPPMSVYQTGGMSIVQMQQTGSAPLDLYADEFQQQPVGMGGFINGLVPGYKRPRGEKISSKDFVPPDVSGLSKREARLVKNRAAAFLSRQRKREEFEAMESHVADLERQNSSLLSQLGGNLTPSEAHAAHIHALQARIATLEQELASTRSMLHAGNSLHPNDSRSPSPSSSNNSYRRTSSYDSFESGGSGASGGHNASQQQAIIGMGLMALLSLSSMSPPTTKFAFVPPSGDAVEEPTPITATPFNYDSIARWQERLATASSSTLQPVSGSPPDGSTGPIAASTSTDATKAEFDIAFSTTDNGRIRCHVSVPRSQLPVVSQPQQMLTATPPSYASSFSASPNPATPYSTYASTGNTPPMGTNGNLYPSPDSMPGSHPGSASSFHTTFEQAGYSTAPVSVSVPQQYTAEEAWAAQQQHQQQQQQQYADWQANAVTPVAPTPAPNPVSDAMPVKRESWSAEQQQVKQEEPTTAARRLGPSRKVRVTLKNQNGRGEWEVEVC